MSLNGLVIPARLKAGGEIRTHKRVSEQGRCHHNGLMSEELRGEYSGAGYTYRSVRARQGEQETERGWERRINCNHRPWVIQARPHLPPKPLYRCVQIQPLFLNSAFKKNNHEDSKKTNGCGEVQIKQCIAFTSRPLLPFPLSRAAPPPRIVSYSHPVSSLLGTTRNFCSSPLSPTSLKA